MKVISRLWKVYSAGLLVLALVGMAAPTMAARGADLATVPTGPAPKLGWVHSPSPGESNTLTSVTGLPTYIPGSVDVWAVGYTSSPDSRRDLEVATLTMHFSTHNIAYGWEVIPSPNLDESNYLTAVSARAWDDVWAVGYASNRSSVDMPLTMHFNGKYWELVAIPEPDDMISMPMRLNHVATVGEKRAVASGVVETPTGMQPLALYYDGTGWSRMQFSGQASGQLLAVEGYSLRNLWAVGAVENSLGTTSTLYHYDGRVWAAMGKASGRLADLALLGDKVLAVGDVQGLSGKQTLAMVYDGTKTTFDRIKTFDKGVVSNQLTAVAVHGNEVYAVGYSAKGSDMPQFETLVLRYDGVALVPVAAPSPSFSDRLHGVSFSNDSIWAVGDSKNGAYTLVLSTFRLSDK